MNEPSGTGIQFVEDAMRDQKWNKKDKKTRIQLTLFLVGLSGILIYTMGINDFTSLLGTMALIGGTIYLITEVKSWFGK